MSVPPPPNQWGSQPPTGGQPAPQWGPQQPWGPPAGPPPSGGGKGKWIWAGIALLAVIAVTVVITVLVVGKDSGGESPTPTNGSGSDFASANDKGPVGIITDDPTCDAWGRIAREYSAQSESVKWADRDQTVPADAWTADQRSMYETVDKALNSATDQTKNLVKLTTHRVMRELYSQFIAYGHAFSKSIPSYTEDDRYLAGTTDGLASALAAICSAIDYRSAQTIAPLISNPDPPSKLATLEDPDNPQPFLSKPDSVCADWTPLVEKFDSDTAEWRKTDPQIPATQWSPQDRAINDQVAPIMAAQADALDELARRSDNPNLQDFGLLAAVYQRGFVKALPSYTTSDFYLSQAAAYLAASVNAACKAAAG
jgi:hypothetical protein